jgi:hypothetical protein
VLASGYRCFPLSTFGKLRLGLVYGDAAFSLHELGGSLVLSRHAAEINAARVDAASIEPPQSLVWSRYCKTIVCWKPFVPCFPIKFL